MTSLDDRMFRLLYDAHHGALTTAAIAFSWAGSGWSLVGLGPLAASKRSRRFAAWLGATLIGTASVVALLKLAFQRDRPYLVYSPLRDALVLSPTDHSFPSGHAAGSFAFALFVTNALWNARTSRTTTGAVAATSIAFASCVAVSRVVLGYHFPTDVLGGAIVGGAIGGVAGDRFARVRLLGR